MKIINKLTQKVENKPKQWRLGQAYFNYLHEMKPDIANKIRATSDDPFYNDNKIPQFFEKLIELLNNE